MSIGTKLIASLIALGAVLLGGLLIVFETLLLPWQVDTLVQEAENTAAFVQQVYPTMDSEDTQRTLERLIRIEPRLSYVVVLDRSGRALMHSSPSRVGMVFDDPGTLRAARDGHSVTQIYTRDPENAASPYYGERVVDISVPNYDRQGQHIGAVSVGLSLGALDAQRQRYYNVLLTAAAALVLGIVALAFWIERDIVGPLKQIEIATTRIDKGAQEIDMGGRKDEIGSLGRHFNAMAARIQSLLAGVREQNVELQDYIDHLTTLNGRVSPEGVILAVNATAARTAGRHPDELIGMKLWDAPWWSHSAELSEKVAEAVSRSALGEEIRFEMENTGWDGETFAVDFSVRPVVDENGHVLYLVAEGRDITQRKRVEEALRDSQRRLADIIDFLPDATFAIDLEGRVTLWNQAVEKLTGVSAEEIIGRDNYACGLAFYGERRPMLVDLVLNPDPAAARLYSNISKEGDSLTAEGPSKALGPEERTLWSKASPLFDPDGRLIGSIETVSDITERRRWFESLRESQRALSTLMDNLPGMAYRCNNDLQYTMEFVSDGCLDLTGYPPGALRNNAQVAYGDLIHPDDRDSVWSGIQQALDKREPFRLVYRIATASGDEKCVWEQGTGVFGDTGELVALEGFITDVTERVRSDEEKRTFYRETILSVTQGKLSLVSREELDGILESADLALAVMSPADTQQVRRELGRMFSTTGVDEERLSLFITAAGEAMTNAVKHAGEGRVSAGVNGNTIWVGVSDEGPGIGALTLPSATLRKGYSSKVSMGMGYAIMLDASDRIKLSSGPEGTTVVLQMFVSEPRSEISLDDLPDTWSQII